MCKQYLDKKIFKNKVEEIKEKSNSKEKIQKEINICINKINGNLFFIDKIYEDKLNGNIDIEMFNRLTNRYKEEVQKYKKSK